MAILYKYKLDYKLYDLVWVKKRLTEDIEFTFVGQVLSRLTPEETFMVRRVPDDPSTLEEIHASHLIPAGKVYKWVHYGVASGRGYFPIDMLRYDHSAPVNFTLDTSGLHIRPQLLEGETKLIIARTTELKAGKRVPGGAFTQDRWASYGWRVEHLKTLKILGEKAP